MIVITPPGTTSLENRHNLNRHHPSNFQLKPNRPIYIFKYRKIPAVFYNVRPFSILDVDMKTSLCSATSSSIVRFLVVLLKARPFSIVDVDMKTSLCSATSSSIVRFQLYSSKSTSIHYCRRGHEDISVLSYIFEYREIPAVFLKARPFTIVDVDMKTSLCSATSSSIVRFLVVLLKARPFSIVDVDMKTSLCSATSRVS
ncbi:hypothetical protein J6590_083290 [Homalodisca vitripennis]|nr:hypothetical protein J6590_083290 [Homalodisca vitripennis]